MRWRKSRDYKLIINGDGSSFDGCTIALQYSRAHSHNEQSAPKNPPSQSQAVRELASQLV